MSNGIVIIGSGFAARQLVKNIRKQDATIPLTLIAADSYCRSSSRFNLARWCWQKIFSAITRR